MSVLVTGGSGTIGTEILRLFAEGGHEGVKALARSAEKVEMIASLGAQPVQAAFEDRKAIRSALEGVETVVLLTPAVPSAEAYASNVIAAAKPAGVRRIVRISAIKADPEGPTNSTRAHGRTETEILQSGVDHVFLRPNIFMQNLFLAAEQIREFGQFSFATGNGKMGMIDTRDVAACAVSCALTDTWDGQALELTGPEAISFFDVADVLGELRGKPVSFAPVSPDDFYAMIEKAGWGTWMAELARDYGTAYAAGWGEFTTDCVEQITGRSPRSIRDFAGETVLPLL